MRPLVAVIVLNWNQEELTMQCLASLEKIDYDNHFIVLVDNGSTDGSDIRTKERFPNINLIRNEKNLGFVEGNNIGIEYGLKRKADYFFLLNNDTKIDADVLRILVEAGESDRKVGITGAINYYYDQPGKICSAGGYFNWWTSRVIAVDGDMIKRYGWNILEKVHFVPGSSILVKKEIIERIGYLDPRFFIYYEEADLCMRAKRAGYKIISVKNTKVLHKVAMTFKRYSPIEYYLYTRNLLLFMKKNCPRLCIASFFLFDVIKIFFRIIKLSLIGKQKEARAVAFGFIDFFKGNFGRGRLDFL